MTFLARDFAQILLDSLIFTRSDVILTIHLSGTIYFYFYAWNTRPTPFKCLSPVAIFLHLERFFCTQSSDRLPLAVANVR